VKPIIQNILVAISGSDASINAAKYALVLAKQLKCSLSAVYVVDTATLRQLVITNIFLQDESEDYEKSLMENGQRYLNYIQELAAQKSVTVETALRKGAVFTEILREAERRACDLIILGGWEKNRSEREIISESHKEILLNSKCSVLIAKERDIERIFKQA
jgi:nucleotide-binding universal stress UspA family protein